jgi:hypothetical protein
MKKFLDRISNKKFLKKDYVYWSCYALCSKLKVKPGQALGLQEVAVPRISRQSAHEGGKVVSSTHRPPLPPIRYPWYLFLLETGLTSRP